MMELNEDVRWILGRPCFWCGSIAQALRKCGFEIKPKAEDKQAVVIYWLLGLYEKHGHDAYLTETEKVIVSAYEEDKKEL
jgi:hypothetical protein